MLEFRPPKLTKDEVSRFRDLLVPKTLDLEEDEVSLPREIQLSPTESILNYLLSERVQEKFMRYFIDGKQYTYEDAWVRYECREARCIGNLVAAYARGLELILTEGPVQLTIENIIELHTMCAAHRLELTDFVTQRFMQRRPSVWVVTKPDWYRHWVYGLRDKLQVHFSVGAINASVNGLKELFAGGRMCFYSEHLQGSPWPRSQEGYESVAKAIIRDGMYAYYAPHNGERVNPIPTTTESIPTLLQDLLSWFNEQMSLDLAPEERVKIIIEFAHKLDQLHPFFDCNLRLSMLLVFCLCVKYGIEPGVFSDPNMFDCFSSVELYDEFKLAQQNARDLGAGEEIGNRTIGTAQWGEDKRNANEAEYQECISNYGFRDIPLNLLQKALLYPLRQQLRQSCDKEPEVFEVNFYRELAKYSQNLSPSHLEIICDAYRLVKDETQTEQAVGLRYFLELNLHLRPLDYGVVPQNKGIPMFEYSVASYIQACHKFPALGENESIRSFLIERLCEKLPHIDPIAYLGWSQDICDDYINAHRYNDDCVTEPRQLADRYCVFSLRYRFGAVLATKAPEEVLVGLHETMVSWLKYITKQTKNPLLSSEQAEILPTLIVTEFARITNMLHPDLWQDLNINHNQYLRGLYETSVKMVAGMFEENKNVRKAGKALSTVMGRMLTRGDTLKKARIRASDDGLRVLVNGREWKAAAQRSPNTSAPPQNIFRVVVLDFLSGRTGPSCSGSNPACTSSCRFQS